MKTLERYSFQRVIMFGPGRGHNVARFFDYFNQKGIHTPLIYFFYNLPDQYDISQFSKVTFYNAWNPLRLFAFLKKENSLIWVHNWTQWPLLIFIYLFKAKKSYLVFNVWSEPIPLLANTKTLKGKFYRWFFRRCNSVMCHWYGTYNLVENVKGVNVQLLRWGMEEDRFQFSPSFSPSVEAEQFVNTLPKEKVKFFLPKSVHPDNNHLLVAKAVKDLVDKNISKFVVYFWQGNYVHEQALKEVEEFIEKEGLSEWVKIVSHGYLTNEDMHFIWNHMDVGINVINKDQLSTSFQEPMLYKKELIASDIKPYKLFEKKFELNLTLISISKQAICNRMEKIINGQRSTNEELENRKCVIESHFRFDKNMPLLLQAFSNKYIQALS